jgi:hypothetical protein
VSSGGAIDRDKRERLTPLLAAEDWLRRMSNFSRSEPAGLTRELKVGDPPGFSTFSGNTGHHVHSTRVPNPRVGPPAAINRGREGVACVSVALGPRLSTGPAPELLWRLPAGVRTGGAGSTAIVERSRRTRQSSGETSSRWTTDVNPPRARTFASSVGRRLPVAGVTNGSVAVWTGALRWGLGR